MNGGADRNRQAQRNQFARDVQRIDVEVRRTCVAGFAGSGHTNHRPDGVGESGQLVVETVPEHRVFGPPALVLAVSQHEHLTTQVSGVTQQGDRVTDGRRQVGRTGWGRQTAECGTDNVVIDRRRVDDPPDPGSGFDHRDTVAGAEVFQETVRELDGCGVRSLVSVSPTHAA